jgi:ornithine cyclodeaminase
MTDARTLIVPHADVEQLLPMPACIDVMADALAATARGDALLPLRQVLRLHSGRDAFAVMPAILGSAIGAKVITVFPGNDATPYESHMGVILYFDDTHGRLLAIIDASSVTAIRTAAVSGLATRLLAVPNASRLAILGAGVQAMTHLEAMMAVRPIRELRIWSRGEATRPAGGMGTHPLRHRYRPSRQRRGGGARCAGHRTVTASRDPVHGRCRPRLHQRGGRRSHGARADTGPWCGAPYVDRRESAMHEAGDFLIPRAENRQLAHRW